MKNISLITITIILGLLVYSCQTDGQEKTSDQNGMATNVALKDTTQLPSEKLDQDSIAKMINPGEGKQVKIGDIQHLPNPKVNKDGPTLSETQKRELWNEKMSIQIHEAMKTMATEYNKGTFNNKITTTKSGLKYWVLEKGDGTHVPAGKVAYIHNFVTLLDGTKVESNFRHQEPLRVRLGNNSMIPGMEEAVNIMDINSNYMFVIPSKLAFGKAGNPPVVPPNSDLLVYVSLTGYE
jgi:FKBP-type peptidyl-prolyl cis-trans isomerase